MNVEPMNAENAYIPADIIIPESWEEAKLILTDQILSIVDAINAREISHYNTTELINGQLWFKENDPQDFRGVYRKVFDFEALPNNTTKSVAHGITIDANTVVTRIYGTATDPNTSFIPLPYVDMSGGSNHIQLDMDGTNVNITTDTDYTGYEITYVVVEYIKN